jgi:hypothetical protein
MSFINYHAHRGHVFGECWSHASSNYMYVNIPKNASSWTKPNLKDWGWECFNYHTDNLDKIPLIVLRDPVDRWLSGIGEYMYLYHKQYFGKTDIDPMVFDLIFDKISLDDHTERQVYFIEELDLDRAVFFKFGNDYRNQFSSFLESIGMNNQYYKYQPQHVSDLSPERKFWKSVFAEQIQNPAYLARIKQHFKQDYDLINSVKFFNAVPSTFNT